MTNRKNKATSDLARAREAAAQARAECLAIDSECWPAVVATSPKISADGELIGLRNLPTGAGSALYGSRLAHDLLGCSADDAAVSQTIADYFAMIGDPAQAFAVFAAALKLIAQSIVPELLDEIEMPGQPNYDVRTILAQRARDAWRMRLRDMPDDDGPGDERH